MKRSPLQRKTPLKSGKRLNPVSKKPRKFRDLNLQQHYRDQFDYCEVSPWLRRNWPEMYCRDERLELHHICRGKGRKDYWSNMIRVNRTFHEWVTVVDEFNGNVLCLAVKLWKSELNLDEFRDCSGKRLEGWLDRHEPLPELRSLWEELMAVAKTQSQARCGSHSPPCSPPCAAQPQRR